jgi:microcystin degradation protein MlrC
LATGAQVRQVFEDAAHEVGGFLAGLDEEELEVLPIFAARALPGGVVTRETFERLLRLMLDQLDAAGPLDGLLVAPHGAAVCDSVPDMDGYWLQRVRQRVGDHLPIVATLDLHANLSSRMVEACDAMVAYRTNPHLDQRARGIEAAQLMARILAGSVRPTQAACLAPMAINIERQHTESEPCQSLYALADAMLQGKEVLSNSVLLGFPYADVEEMGTSLIVVTDNHPELATQLVQELEDQLLAGREDFAAHLIGIDEALERAERLDGPVCLLDMGDNIGGGSAADGTSILHAIRRRGGPTCFACLCDPEAARQAITAGVQERVADLAMGGKTDPRLGPPLVADIRVASVHAGTFTENQIRHGGKNQFDMGPTAIVETTFGLTLMLTSQRIPPFSLKQLTSCGIDPSDYQVLVAKGVQAPLAAYGPICPNWIRVNTPGPTCADMTQLEYQHRRRPLFPFEREARRGESGCA